MVVGNGEDRSMRVEEPQEQQPVLLRKKSSNLRVANNPPILKKKTLNVGKMRIILKMATNDETSNIVKEADQSLEDEDDINKNGGTSRNFQRVTWK